MANDYTNHPPRRRPLLSNTLRTLSRIYSIFPEENPFSQFPDFNYTPQVWRACSVPQKSLVKPTSDDVGNKRNETDDFMQFESSGNAEVRDLPIGNGTDKDGNVEVLCEGDGLKRSEMIVNQLNGAKETETVSKAVSNEDTNDHTAEPNNLSKGLLGIETLLMDEVDDMDILQMSDKDINFDILDDFGTFTIGDGLGSGSLPIESTGNDKMIGDGNLKEDMVVEDKGKDIEAKKLTSGDDALKSHAHVHKEREKSGSSEVVNQLAVSTPQDVGRKESKVSSSKGCQDASKISGLIFLAQKRKNEGGTISGDKGHNSGAVEKQKTKRSTKKATKDVKSGKSKRISLDGECSNRTKFGDGDSMVYGKTDKLNVLGKQENKSEKLVGKCRPTKCEKIQYNREQLMHLRGAAVPVGVLNAVKEISAQLHGEKQNPTVGEGSKERGSSSETRKEKKKRRRREKRTEMNKKLGVKTLKLKPILKPKHCRHYPKGRCQEGEKCKFSHDMTPQTKSKPCCHSAQNSCMKGDECPFDHQLLKYPCNNIVETGFCGRGDSCLFSHKISEAKVGVSKNEICSLDQPEKSKKSVPSSRITPMPKNLNENLTVEISSNKPAKAPKGVSFMSFGKTSVDDNSAKSQPNVDFPSLVSNSGISSETETRNGNDSDKLKGVISDARLGSLSGPGKSTQSTAQRALLSTLAFASKLESGIKMTSRSTNDKKPMKASAVFELLYGGTKEKQ